MKVDATTLEQARGKYARICIEVDLKKELLSEFALHGKTYCLQYESLHTVCFCCGLYEHLLEACLEKKTFQEEVDEEAYKDGNGIPN